MCRMIKNHCHHVKRSDSEVPIFLARFRFSIKTNTKQLTNYNYKTQHFRPEHYIISPTWTWLRRNNQIACWKEQKLQWENSVLSWTKTFAGRHHQVWFGKKHCSIWSWQTEFCIHKSTSILCCNQTINATKFERHLLIQIGQDSLTSWRAIVLSHLTVLLPEHPSRMPVHKAAHQR